MPIQHNLFHDRHYILPIDQQLSAMRPAPVKTVDFDLVQPRPRWANECSDMWQARIALWDKSASSPMDDCAGEGGHYQATLLSRSTSSASSSSSSSSISYYSLPTDSGYSPADDWSTSIVRHPTNDSGMPTDFLDEDIYMIGDAKAFPPFKSGTPPIITEYYAMDCIQEVDSPSTLGRAVRAVCSVMWRERSKRRGDELKSRFRSKVLELMGEEFSGVSSPFPPYLTQLTHINSISCISCGVLATSLTTRLFSQRGILGERASRMKVSTSATPLRRYVSVASWRCLSGWKSCCPKTSY